jgi:hypothetical protein
VRFGRTGPRQMKSVAIMSVLVLVGCTFTPAPNYTPTYNYNVSAADVAQCNYDAEMGLGNPAVPRTMSGPLRSSWSSTM